MDKTPPSEGISPALPERAHCEEPQFGLGSADDWFVLAFLALVAFAQSLDSFLLHPVNIPESCAQRSGFYIPLPVSMLGRPRNRL